MFYPYAFLIVAALAASLHTILSRKPLSPGRIPAICLIHLLLWPVGLAGIVSLYGSLAISIIALLSLWIRGTFYLAAVIAAAFSFGWQGIAGALIDVQIIPISLAILIPALLILFTILYRVRGGKERFRMGLSCIEGQRPPPQH